MQYFQQFLSANGQFVQKVKFDCSLVVDFPFEFNQMIAQPMGFLPNSTSQNVIFLHCNPSSIANNVVDASKDNDAESNISPSNFINKNSSSTNVEPIDVVITSESHSSPASIVFHDTTINTIPINFERFFYSWWINEKHFCSNCMDQRFLEQYQQIALPLKKFAKEISSISKGLLDLQKDITLRRCIVNREELLNRISWFLFY